MQVRRRVDGEQRVGLHVVGGKGAKPKGVQREGSAGWLVVLPKVWAVGERKSAPPVHRDGDAAGQVDVEVAFYRKYTEAMLRRFAVMSMESGRVPSLLGRELFRGHVTHYEVKGFDDVVIFCHDVETCLKRLDPTEQKLIKRVAIQQYTLAEAAPALGMSLRTCVRQYGSTLDRLTRIFLKAKLLEPLKGCQ